MMNPVLNSTDLTIVSGTALLAPNEAVDLGLGYCRNTTGWDHFSQRLFDDAEHTGFEAII